MTAVDKFKNNKIMRYLLINYFDSDRKALAQATFKSESAVGIWFRTKANAVNDDTLELLLYKLNTENKKIVIPNDI